jgi:hypothetical protein
LANSTKLGSFSFTDRRARFTAIRWTGCSWRGRSSERIPIVTRNPALAPHGVAVIG